MDKIDLIYGNTGELSDDIYKNIGLRFVQKNL